MNQPRLPRCPKGSRRNKSSGLCEQKSPTISLSSPLNTLIKRKSKTRQKRCPNGSYRNKNTGLCEQKVVIRKSPIKKKGRPIRHMYSISPKKTRFKKIPSVIKNNKRNHNEVITPKILNFYKDNATPIFEGDIDDHPGSYNFTMIAFNYLKKRYSNLSVFVNTFDQNPETLSFLVKPNNQINVRTTMAADVMSFNTETNEIEQGMNYNYLLKQIKKNMNEKKRFFAIDIALVSEIDYEAHANMLIFDSKNNTLELFDPNSYITHDIFKPEKVKFLIKYIFSQIRNNIFFIDSKFINPHIGLQIEQSKENLTQLNEIDGYCGAWSFFYLQMRIANPNINQIILIKQLKVEIKNKGNFFNMIRNYVKYIFNKGYRHKYNIKPRKLEL